jgi:hypothetical protein
VVRSVQSGRVGLQFVQVKDDGDARLQKFLAGRETGAPAAPSPASPASPGDDKAP